MRLSELLKSSFQNQNLLHEFRVYCVNHQKVFKCHKIFPLTKYIKSAVQKKKKKQVPHLLDISISAGTTMFISSIFFFRKVHL